MIPRIKSVKRRDETILRLGGMGDNFHMTWAADDRQYAALCDGWGWFDKPNGMHNSRLFAISSGPKDASFSDVPGYPYLIPEVDAPHYYSFGTLALAGKIYQYLSTFNRGQEDIRFVGAKLIYSPDNGRTWRNQDGSIPVVWESWEHRSRETMVFFEEPGEAFSLPSIAQMGRDYSDNRDGYVYVYAPNGNVEGLMNELVMFRVAKNRILSRDDYEFFAGRNADGTARWAKSIDARAVVHTFPRGWVNRRTHPYAWQPSVVYHAGLGCYLMTTWGMDCTANGDWFGKPSYLGFWMAETPWGPWEQIHEETAWMPGNDPNARAYQPQIAPKWMAQDGKSLWLVWTDFQKLQSPECAQGEKNWMQLDDAGQQRHMTQCMPYYAFNTQRVDLEWY
jgi:hypothetical protein